MAELSPPARVVWIEMQVLDGTMYGPNGVATREGGVD